MVIEFEYYRFRTGILETGAVSVFEYRTDGLSLRDWEIERCQLVGCDGGVGVAASAAAASADSASPSLSRIGEINETNCIRMGIDWERDGARRLWL